MSHLSGQGDLSSLTVAVAARQLAMFPTGAASPAAAPSRVLAPGQGIEFLDESGHTYIVRTSENVEGHLYKSALLRQPVLPDDEVKAAQ